MKISEILQLPFAWLISVLWGEKEREGQEGENMDYNAFLDKYGYEAQYHAYLKDHNGSNEGFTYKDVNYPGKGNWQ